MNESLVKYLAGLLDADGSLSFAFRQDDNKPDRLYMQLRLSLASSDAVDQRGFVDSLPEMTGMGGVSRHGVRKQFTTWTIGKRSDLEMLVPRLIKHMCIKAKHWQWLLDTWRETRGTPLDAVQVEAFKLLAKESRATRSGPLKPKNHPTWAWTAGFMDGDGYYTCNWLKPNNCWVMRIGCVAHKNDAHVLDFIAKAFGGRITEHGQTPTCLAWYRGIGVSERSFALRFLPEVAKHSRLKRHKIDQMIHIHQQRLSAPTPAGEAIV